MSTCLSDYDYDLPRELIAQHPLPRREDSRMMVLHRDEQKIEHARFVDLKKFLRDGGPSRTGGYLVVLNNSRVLPARHFSDDGKLEFLFLEKIAARRWKALVKPGRRFGRNAVASIEGVQVKTGEIFADGSREVILAEDVDVQRGGAMPLPPYIKRSAVVDRRYREEDDARYQTVFAKHEGSLAAPTAGLHFTPEILETLPHVFITLHVGTATFRPVKTENVTQHQMHPERFSIAPDAAAAIAKARQIVAVGTTTARVLESVHRTLASIQPIEGETDIFIYPPFQFRVVDVLLTNFHLPRSTLLMLVSAFAGREFILRAYEEAVRARYRFFSYGDCMLIL
ncbi:MAG: tRNA preQ1(34) S-adenosylmethionine ribosyltransferase-isomerase QueA [Verrucomicrobia bacterium]|nr:MAG: tRNA preQ1(34) S-adenosylmethionine ribosyltransferase-isomerase QueA [Verrucomicrobiota bacterium]PYL47060.1 MAG: tRNA preQ1(34) S-adenosylmethionine ribosyltransferase-isomerase QueA [Verrucomicrobiota bacterium]